MTTLFAPITQWTIAAFMVWDGTRRAVVDVEGYEFASELARITGDALAEDAALRAGWEAGPLAVATTDDERAAAGTKGAGRIVEEATEYMLLQELSTHLIDFFARPGTAEELAGLLAWADAERLDVGVVGSGSNLLVADDGFRGLVLKLGGALAAIERDGDRLRCGGGARLPKASAFAASEGLSGLEFGVNIPGTVGGAVKMNGR